MSREEIQLPLRWCFFHGFPESWLTWRWVLPTLASLLRDQGLLGEAVPLLERALVIREQTLGAQHPDTATVLVMLAAAR